MEAEEVWGLWLSLESYINKKDTETAIGCLLNYLLEYEFEEFTVLAELAEQDEEFDFAKVVKKFIKYNELDEEEGY